jgi:hypothetical protein
MNWKIERAHQELPAELAIFARRAFVRSCERVYGVAVPIKHVVACTFQRSKQQPFFLLAWQTEDLMRTLALGHFYRTQLGGQVMLRFLQTETWERVPVDRARRDVYFNVRGFPAITEP